MIYITFLGALLFATRTKTILQRPNRLVPLLELILLLLATLRFGEGVDYFSYQSLYNSSPLSLAESITAQYWGSGMEIGYRAISGAGRLIGLKFQYIASIIAFFNLCLIYSTIKRRTPSRSFSLLIFFAGYYFVYVESLLRQSIAFSIFLRAYFVELESRKYIMYAVLIVIGSLFHSTALVMLIVLPFHYLDFSTILRPQVAMTVLLVCLASGFFLGQPLIRLAVAVTKYGSVYLGSGHTAVEISWVSLLHRLIKLGIVLALYHRVRQRLSRFEVASCVVYVLGLLFYIVFLQIPLFSRVSDYFMATEIVLFPMLIVKLERQQKTVFLVAIQLISIVLFFKTLSSTILLASYYNSDPFSYPFVTIFNANDISLFRNMTSYSNFVEF